MNRFSSANNLFHRVVTQGFKRGFEEADIMGPLDQLGPAQGGMQGGWQQQQQQGGDYAEM